MSIKEPIAGVSRGAVPRGERGWAALWSWLTLIGFVGWTMGCESASSPESPTRSSGTPSGVDSGDDDDDDDDGDDDDSDDDATGAHGSAAGWQLLFESALTSVAPGTAVTALTRVSATAAVVHLADGSAVAVDLTTGTGTPLPIPIDVAAGSRVITASASYAWVIAADGKTAGRNRQPAAGANKVEVSRVNVSDLAPEGEPAEPVAATDESLFFVAADALVVLTWIEPSIRVQRIPFPADYVRDGDEVVLGAGAIGTASDAWWVATDKRLLTYEGDGSWTRVPLSLSSQGPVGEPRRAALWVTGDSPRPRNGAVVFGEAGLGRFQVDRAD